MPAMVLTMVEVEVVLLRQWWWWWCRRRQNEGNDSGKHDRGDVMLLVDE